MFFDEEEQKPSQPIRKVISVFAPGKPPRPNDNNVKLLQGEGGSKDDHDKDQKKMEVCDVGGDDGDEDLVDPQVKLKECCSRTDECTRLREALQECNDRVNSREKTLETCVMEMYDFVHCVDHCVAKELFRYLK